MQIILISLSLKSLIRVLTCLYHIPEWIWMLTKCSIFQHIDNFWLKKKIWNKMKVKSIRERSSLIFLNGKWSPSFFINLSEVYFFGIKSCLTYENKDNFTFLKREIYNKSLRNVERYINTRLSWVYSIWWRRRSMTMQGYHIVVRSRNKIW